MRVSRAISANPIKTFIKGSAVNIPVNNNNPNGNKIIDPCRKIKK